MIELKGIKEIREMWEAVTKKLNQENQCGLCFEFYASLEDKKLNLVRGSGKCCVKIFLLVDKSGYKRNTRKYSNGFYTGLTRNLSYQVLFLMESKEGINNYNELEGHSLDESRLLTIFEPLERCIDLDVILSLCEYAPVTSDNTDFVFDYQDEMYYGFKTSITQQVEL